MALDLSSLEMVALLETPTGFAFFHVYENLCKGPKVIFLLEFIKFEDKSVAWKSGGPGLLLTRAIKKYCGKSIQLIVGDVELRGVIKSNLNVKCFENEDVIFELMWGLKHVLSYYVRQERGNITLEYRLPLSQGLKDCMSKYEVIIPTEAIDRTFVGCASALHRCDVLLEHYRKRLPEICEPFLPGIREIVNGDIPYAEVVAKILTPDRVQDCNPFEGLSDDVVKKIKDVAANNAGKKVDRAKHRLIYGIARDVRKFPGYRTDLLQTLKSLADKRSGRQKRSQTEILNGQAAKMDTVLVLMLMVYA
ncbi:hypothetical protein PVAP13_3KG548701 [Panicum virgatum]|uniref:Uncharacterized protein n=1 Tax=Panicum virgatum TaxID=38727 RepID=A0A8T0V289_PANVG|nr:hypothetical protein PVAP13_3KG548701 [Panicum virgatum]